MPRMNAARSPHSYGSAFSAVFQGAFDGCSFPNQSDGPCSCQNGYKTKVNFSLVDLLYEFVELPFVIFFVKRVSLFTSFENVIFMVNFNC